MKPSWKGSLTFGLVDINVELYSAIAPHIVGFKLLHSTCLKPITYQRWCAHCKKEVAWDEIEKGIQLKDGTYFVMTPANLKKLKPKRTENIAITEFVDSQAIDPILFNQHYYVTPSMTVYQQHAFFLFSSAMADMNKIAIGQFVMRDKEYVVAIRPYKNILLLTTLNYAYEVKKLARIDELKKPKIDTKELKLATQLIGSLSTKIFDIKKYKDTFATELVKKISKLKKGIGITTQKKEIKKPKEASLLQALQASIKHTQKPLHEKITREVTKTVYH